MDEGSTSERSPPKTLRSQSTRTYIAIGIVAIVALVIVIVLVGFYHPGAGGTGTGTVLAASGTSWGIQGNQYQAVDFSVSSPVHLSGAFTTTYNVTAYLFTAANYLNFTKTGVVPGYQWTSGVESGGTLSVEVPSGAWALVFVDPNPAQATNVLITSTIEISAS